MSHLYFAFPLRNGDGISAIYNSMQSMSESHSLRPFHITDTAREYDSISTVASSVPENTLEEVLT